MDRKILLQNLADSLAERTGITKRKAEAFVRSFFEVTEDGLIADGIVKAKGFGTTKIVAVSGRESVNINTGERFQIEGHDKVTFTPDGLFRDLVNRPFAHFATTILADNLDEEELAAAAGLLHQEEEPTIEEEVTPTEEETPAEEQAPTEEVIITEEDTSEETPEPSEETAETTIEAEALTESHSQESSQHTETTEDMQQPIIIQNTIPESRHNWWRTGFVVLATLVLMTLSYFAGYYRVFCPCAWDTFTQQIPVRQQSEAAKAEVVSSSHEQTATVSKQATSAGKASIKEAQPATDEKAESLRLAEDKAAAERLAAQRAAEAKKTAAEKAAAEKANAEKKLKDAARKYRQMDGDYLITGVLETHEMKVGDNLYKLARQAYGEKRLATYIIFHNQISNPDLVQLGQKIEIPQLTKK